MRRTTLAWMWGAGVGAGTMWLLDSGRGRRRRALLRDKLARARHTTGRAVAVTGRDLAHRVTGTVAAMRGWAIRGDADDEVVVERVRSALGRYATHPSALHVTCRQGVVTLEGLVLAHEVKPLIDAIRRVPGVHEVVNRLDEHEHAGTIPGLQGGGSRREPRSAFMRENWAPATRFIAALGGVGLMAWGARRPTPIASASLAAGAGLLVRSATNLELRRLVGLTSRRAVDIQKTITIDAPISEVFALWSDFTRFPQFMRHVRDVRDLGDGRSRWTVDGPGGVPVHWDAEITRLIPDQLIAWKSLPDAAIAHTGLVRFEAMPSGATRLTIRLSYNPVAGMAGHGVAMLLGADPKHQLDDDLVRMKTFLEQGVVPHDAARRDRTRSGPMRPDVH